MMRNSSQVSHFILGAYFDPGPLRWLYFLILMSVYVLIVLSNLLLIVVICLNRTLHEPMYIFICSLLINDIYGSTALCPLLLVQILKDFHTVSYHMCLLQIFCIYSYASVNFTNLAVMSYDRYVAICFPLQYNTRMNSNKVAFLITLIWLPVFVAVLVMILLTSSLTLCGNFINKVYCDNYSVVSLSCSDTTVNNLYELMAATVIIAAPVSVIFFTYVRILRVCFNGTKQMRQKALSTCTPHLCALFNFSFGASFHFIQTRVDLNHWPQILTIILTLYHVICEPLMNALMYGLNLSKIRKACKSLFLKSKTSLFKSKNKTMMEMK